jgi:protein-S-isoprenylcysteine O-methyltransferase
MTPLPFVWPYALLFWSVYVFAFWPEFGIVRRARRAQTAADGKSLQVILLVQSVGLFLAYPLAWIVPLQFTHRVPALYAGLALLVAASLLRRHCFRMLGSSFTGDVRVSAGQEVVDRGAYRLLRHPAYTAGILMNVAIGIALGSWASAALAAVTSTASYLYRIAVEERALATVIGEPYRQFMRSRKRLIPFVY